jgi:hypothetical protein
MDVCKNKGRKTISIFECDLKGIKMKELQYGGIPDATAPSIGRAL